MASAAAKAAAEFSLPPFYNYPPYFTLQPVRDTRERQLKLWKELVLRYCAHHRMFVVDIANFELFNNDSIQRRLSHEARVAILSALVADGRAEWVDKQQQQCWVLWRTWEEWAAVISTFVRDNGLSDSVMTMEEIRTGDETRDTELHGMHAGALARAVAVLEQQGKALRFKGTTADDEGIKFLSQL